MVKAIKRWFDRKFKKAMWDSVGKKKKKKKKW